MRQLIERGRALAVPEIRDGESTQDVGDVASAFVLPIEAEQSVQGLGVLGLELSRGFPTLDRLAAPAQLGE